MGELTAEKVAQRAFRVGILDERQIKEIWGALASRDVSAHEFLQLCLRREFLTNYQVERLLKGEKGGYFYGDYKVLYYVGAGTFARVYRASHKTTGKVVALKVLRSKFFGDPRQAEKFVQEGRLGMQLRHPNIVPTYEVYSRGQTHFMVMEFVEGRSLREFVKVRGKLQADEATKMAIDICAGLSYAFERTLTHRDLKMTNVLVSSRGVAKLVDFGLAGLDETAADDLDDFSPNARTVDYAALERVTGVRKDDPRSDIYFLGCIYYHMLTGQPPLPETRDRAERMNPQRFQNVVPIQQLEPGINPAVILVVNRAMSLDPETRYQVPAGMLADLRKTARRLLEEQNGGPPSEQGEQLAARAQAADAQHSVMVVESDVEMQDVFRNGFKKAGYRVLVTADPARAVDRFRQDPETAECILFSSRELGAGAVEAFNALGQDPQTAEVPAVLLLDARHKPLVPQARLAKHRVLVAMPCTLKDLRDVTRALVKRRHAKRAK